MTKPTGYRAKALAILLAASAAFPAASVHAQNDSRGVSVDFILLVDKSKSMFDAMPAVKRYLAGELIGPLVLPGDRVSVVAFYGKTETLWSGPIQREEDKAALVRSLNALEPDGSYTDIGKALDTVDGIIAELNAPERPKFVLLVTDERQEAPEGSKYYAADYKIRHPYLTYVKREDRGTFRAITIGYGLEAKIDASAKKLTTILTDPPERPAALLPGADGAPRVYGEDGTPRSGTAPAGSAAPGSAAAGSAAPGEALPGSPGSTQAARDKPAGASAPLVAVGAFAGLAVAGFFAWLALRKRHKGERGDGRAA